MCKTACSRTVQAHEPYSVGSTPHDNQRTSRPSRDLHTPTEEKVRNARAKEEAEACEKTSGRYDTPDMRLQSPGYDSSPAAVNLPLTMEEVDWLVENGRAALKDNNRRTHLLQRVRTTLVSYRTALNDLHREISSLRAEVAQPTASTSMNPLDAARFLSDEQKEHLFVGSMRQAWTALLRLRNEAAQLKAQANRELGLARFHLEKALDSPALPEKDKELLRRSLETLPQSSQALLRFIPAPMEDLPDALGMQVKAHESDQDEKTAKTSQNETANVDTQAEEGASGEKEAEAQQTEEEKAGEEGNTGEEGESDAEESPDEDTTSLEGLFS